MKQKMKKTKKPIIRIEERELVLPTLFLLSKSEQGRISTTELIDKLRELLRPTGEDLDILAGRTDDKFSQKVRNLVSHSTLEREKYAKHKDGVFILTRTGRDYLNEKYTVFKYLITNDFEWEDLKKGLNEVEKNRNKKIEVFDENLLINEGAQKTIPVKVYERSVLLRKAAIDAFTVKGIISCHCCKFNFDSYYGKKISNGYIEIHHIKPILKYSEQELIKCIKDAVKNLMPVCSNCHRMIHKNWQQPLPIDTLMKSIDENGKHVA